MTNTELTPAQYEIMQIVWQTGRCGASVAAIWREISKHRPVARTTVLNLVDRLEKRGFLRRQEARPNQEGHANRFVSNVSRRKICSHILKQFVDDYYDGSASALVEALLRFKCLSATERSNLHELLAEHV